MKYRQMKIPGLWLLEPEPFEDHRGFFARVFCQSELAERGIDFTPVQANLSGNHLAGTLRGLHFQRGAGAEDKLVRAVSGRIFDVAVDLRADSPTFGQWDAAELSAENRLSLLVPKGCAHGYLTLTDNAEALYLVSTPYQPGAEGGLRWNDPALAINWPAEPRIVSDKDSAWPDFDPAAFRNQ